jgi:glyoxylate carboligase
VAEEPRVLLGFGIVALYAGLQLVINVLGILGGAPASTLNPEDFSDLAPESASIPSYNSCTVREHHNVPPYERNG